MTDNPPGDAYSRTVLISKIVLPLVALGILSTLFLLPGDVEPDGSIPFATFDAESLTGDQRLSNARFSSVTADGTAISLEARRAEPDGENPNSFMAEDVRAQFDLLSGAQVRITSTEAQVDLSADRADLRKGVTVTTTRGDTVETEALTAHIDRTEIFTETPVRATLSFGTVEAGRMRLHENSDQPGTLVLVLNNGVKLLYMPDS